MLDRLIPEFDRALRAMTDVTRASRSDPADVVIASTVLANTASNATRLSEAGRRHAAGLICVNHVSKVCVQVLYQGQALFAQDLAIRAQLDEAAREEGDHPAWCTQRLQELNDRLNLLNPLWYAGAFTTGASTGCLGDKISLGLVVEAERQAEYHLDGHFDKLPEQDTRSYTIVAQMRKNEARHGDNTRQASDIDLPASIRQAMRAASRVMTVIAYRI